MTIDQTPEALADWLLSPEAIRVQCQALFDLCETGDLAHFTLDLSKLDACADEVVATIQAAYPDLNVPPHARWRHFVFDQQDHWAEAVAKLDVSVQERARLECELAIVSVLLDAGAGAAWGYTDPGNGKRWVRSEGLAMASLHMFLNGAFHSQGRPGTTAEGLLTLKTGALADAFHVSDDNHLEGLEGRADLIRALGAAVMDREDVFGETPRLGNIADHLFGLGSDDGLPARDILRTCLDVFGPIWPDRPTMAGRSLGDCWTHPQAPNGGLVPFHKLSQWLSYSLVEPMERAGLDIIDLNALTGLAEYRNGGLFVDTGVLQLRDPTQAPIPQNVDSALVVEWRALTVILLDRIADLVRLKLGKSAEDMPLAAVLEGGTWATGRRIAKAMRADGSPPIAIHSTGTVF